MANDRLFIPCAGGGKIRIPVARLTGVDAEVGWAWAETPVVSLAALPLRAQMREIQRLVRLPGRHMVTLVAARASYALAKVSHQDLFVWGIDQVLSPHLSDRFMKLRQRLLQEKFCHAAREGEST